MNFLPLSSRGNSLRSLCLSYLLFASHTAGQNILITALGTGDEPQIMGGNAVQGLCSSRIVLFIVKLAKITNFFCQKMIYVY